MLPDYAIQIEMSIETTQAMSTKQLSNIYQIDPRTLKNWLKPFKNKIGERTGRLWTPKQVGIIKSVLES